jgi:hypothetical protein
MGARQLSWWLEWPAGSFRIGVVFLVAVTAVAVLLAYPGIVRDSDRGSSSNSSLSFADRDVAGGNALVADQAAVYEARGRIPENASYHVSVADDYEGGTELTVPFVASFYRYFLMPRRQAEDAPWVICYGCDLDAYGSRADVVWESPEGIAIARVRP